MMVSGNISKVGMSKAIVEPCGVCRPIVNANSVLYVKCGKLIHIRYAEVNMVTANLSGNFACRTY